MDASGARVLPEIGTINSHQEGFSPRYSVASDGERYLITRDRVVSKKPMSMLGVQARLLPADWKGDGKLDESFFLVAGDGSKSCLMGQAAAGPKGSFLVTYVEARGAEDIKILARIVK
jgi:hypothetical protein